MKPAPTPSLASILALLLCLASFNTQAELDKRMFCIFDPVGANGPVFNLMHDVKAQALGWGYELDLKAYTDEKVASDDFRAGQCDAVLLTDVRAREFNRFTGSLNALGAIPSDEELRTVLQTIMQPKARKLMVSGGYEVVGIMPAGGVYVFLRDRSVNRVEKIQGKKIATFDYDAAAVQMVRHVGASIVGATSTNFAGKFNNGSVDVAYAPAIAYTPLELYKGLEGGGGVYDYKFAQMTYQAVVHTDKFDDAFSSNARGFFLDKFDDNFKMIHEAESEIAQHFWVRPTPDDAAGFDDMLREVRVGLREEGIYDGRALQLMRKVRCKTAPTHAECVQNLE